MELNIKISLTVLLGLCFTGLSLLHPLWLAGVAGCLLLLWKLALTALRNSETDPLTGLWNLRRLERKRLRYEKHTRLAVLYLDLDDLKQINDTQGHPRGNAALQEVACTLLDADDDAYRIGGDEFLLISVDMNAEELASCWHDAAEGLSVSVSWGTAQGSGAELDVLIARAEEDMYRKK